MSFRRRQGLEMEPTFLIVAPDYTHKSGGVRALYRLCHHLNAAGYPAAMTPMAERIKNLPDWLTPVHTGPAADSIVVYPEVVSGNPLNAGKVVRWTLNNPGLLGGDQFYSDDEMVFAFNPERRAVVNRAVTTPLGANRILRVALIDPAHIYPDRCVRKTIDCYFVHKGGDVRAHAPLPFEDRLQRLEYITPSMASLGEFLRRTRTLYSYDHASTVLKEAVICGCNVLVVHEDGRLLDPESCGCRYNVYWGDGFRADYARQFHDSSFVENFVRELATRWDIPPPQAGPVAWPSIRHKRKATGETAPADGRVSGSAATGKPLWLAGLTRFLRRARFPFAGKRSR